MKTVKFRTNTINGEWIQLTFGTIPKLMSLTKAKSIPDLPGLQKALKGKRQVYVWICPFANEIYDDQLLRYSTTSQKAADEEFYEACMDI